MSLYQEVRPVNLDYVVGNNSTIGALKTLVSRKPNDRPHTILFKGPMGCGKTTLARILAREFGALPDNVFKYNVANTRGIDTIRDIGNKIHLAALGGGVKVYIFDESHRFTKDAEPALLEMTEDTPEHCYFIFCTTDPQSILGPLRNRCTEYEVNPLSSKSILTILKQACAIKKLTLSPGVLEVIACNSEGCPRTSLVLLEKIIGIESEEAVMDLLISEIDSHTEVFDLCRMLLRKPEIRRKEWKRLLFVFDSIAEMDSERIRYGILGFLLKQLQNINEKEVEYAQDVVRMLEIFSVNTFYGKKKQLTALVLKACFM